jgi:hypothetical protein
MMLALPCIPQIAGFDFEFLIAINTRPTTRTTADGIDTSSPGETALKGVQVIALIVERCGFAR